jgi:hypothetical protein
LARRPRVHFPGALYHVISRGNQRQKIYKDDLDYQRFETLLGEVLKRHSLTLYGYVLMPNHFHLLLERSGVREGSGVRLLILDNLREGSGVRLLILDNLRRVADPIPHQRKLFDPGRFVVKS